MTFCLRNKNVPQKKIWTSQFPQNSATLIETGLRAKNTTNKEKEQNMTGFGNIFERNFLNYRNSD